MSQCSGDDCNHSSHFVETKAGRVRKPNPRSWYQDAVSIHPGRSPENERLVRLGVARAIQQWLARTRATERVRTRTQLPPLKIISTPPPEG